VKFEWDAEKNAENIRKHGFDFADTWEIFELPMLVSPDKRQSYEEDRFIGVGFLRQRIVVLVFAEYDDGTYVSSL
jgi:uncharacterized DUF497 family protein